MSSHPSDGAGDGTRLEVDFPPLVRVAVLEDEHVLGTGLPGVPSKGRDVCVGGGHRDGLKSTVDNMHFRIRDTGLTI